MERIRGPKVSYPEPFRLDCVVPCADQGLWEINCACLDWPLAYMCGYWDRRRRLVEELRNRLCRVDDNSVEQQHGMQFYE